MWFESTRDASHRVTLVAALRRGLAAFLKEHPLVAKFDLAPNNQGGGGVTVVELKD